MEFSSDELAGLVDMFGALTRAELEEALVELAFRRGEERDPADFASAVEEARASYHLVEFEPAEGAEPVFVPGPVAFPELPSGAADVPHILAVEERSVDREAAGVAAAERFRVEAARVVAAGDEERTRELLDVSYELEAWAPVDLTDARRRIDDALA